MADERFVALGRAICRAMEADPTSPEFGGDNVHAKLIAAFPGLKHFLEARLAEAKKHADNTTPAIQATRDQEVSEIQDEIKWVNECFLKFGQAADEKKLSTMHDNEARKYQNEPK